MPPLEIAFGGYQGTGSVHHRAVEILGQNLRAALGDRVNFRIEGNVLAQGRKSGDLPPMVERGALDMCYISSVRLSGRLPELQALEVPFLTDRRERIYRALDGDAGDYLKDIVANGTGFHLLGFWDNGFRHITNRVHAIRRPADCRGLRIRTQIGEMPGRMFRLLGFEPVAMDIGRFLGEIGGGRVDAQDNPLTSIRDFNIHRHHPFITLTGHVLGVTLLLVNRERYRGWPEAVRQAVDDAAADATAAQRRLAAARDAEVLAAFESSDVEIVHLSDAERAAFAEAVSPLVARFSRQAGRLLKN